MMVFSSPSSFTPVHFTAGNATAIQQLRAGLSEALPSGLERSSLAFDNDRRTIVFALYIKGGEFAANKAALWPLRGEISYDDILARGVRLDPERQEDDEVTLLRQPPRYNLRVGLRRPPGLWYEYPLDTSLPQSKRGRPSRGRGGGRGGGRGNRRRATEEDYIILTKDKLGIRSGGSVQTLDPVSVVGLPTSQAFHKPGQWLTLEFTFVLVPAELIRLRQTLASLRASSPTPLFDALPANTLPPTFPLPPNPGSLLSSIVPYRFETRYLMEGLISYGVVTGEDLTTLCGCLSREGESSEMRDRLLTAMFPLGRVSGKIKQVLDDLRYKLTSRTPTRSLPSHSVLVRRVLVTPTRILLCPPEQETSNTVLRMYPDQIDRFLRVQFADEGEPMHYAEIWNDYREPGTGPTAVTYCPGRGMVGRIRRVLEDGLEFSGRRWKFLAAGGSQLKERQAWFISEKGEDFTVAKLLAKMGDFTKEKTIAKHAARISLCFSTTRLVDLKHLKVKQTADIQRGNYTFTDGCGITSQLVIDQSARAIKGKLIRPGTYSAGQYRIGGAKGMLVAWPEVEAETVVLRPSMQKFESEHRQLGVMKMAEWAPAHLNRQAIMILDAMGVSNDVLLAAFLSQLDRLDHLAERAALPAPVEELLQATPVPLQRLIWAGLGSDPFVRDALQLIQLVLRWDLKWKARIRVDQGTFLYGVADEYGVLEEGEVFCRYHNPDDVNQRGVVEGDCLVFRSPALHPGDIQHVRAVNHPALFATGIKNVIIFSIKGKRDLPNMLAGGDLDGDMFTLIWDPAIVFGTVSAPPMDYTPSAKPATVPVVKQEHMHQWFIDYFTNDQLGALSVAHLTIADREGVAHPACLQLAKLASDAVDYTKSGIPVIYPPELRDLAKKRPDFLGSFNPDLVYESRHLLGTLFRLVSDEFSRPAVPQSAGASGSSAHLRLVARAREVPLEYLIEATRLRREYEVDMQGGMSTYLVTELELVCGLVGGLAVPLARRKGMMKDDGLKTDLRSHLALLVQNNTALAQNFILSRSPARPTHNPPAHPLTSEQTFALAVYLMEHHPPSKRLVWEDEHEDELVAVDGQPMVSGGVGENKDGLGKTFWVVWAKELMGILDEEADGGGRRGKRERVEDVGEDELQGRRGQRGRSA